MTNLYQIDTEIRMGVTFYDVSLNLPADPITVTLFVEDPDGTVTQVPANQIVRTGVGAYYANYLPSGPGQWAYKWQGTGNVIATSRDMRFCVAASDLIDS